MASEQNGNGAHHVEGDAQLRSPQQRDSLIRRSWHAILSPFSQSALASLPNVRRPTRHLRADNIPETETNDAQERPTVRDYHSINSLPPNVHVPKKIPTSVKVEAKVWFANERTWISWLSNSVLIAALSLGLFNASKDDIARTFAYVYAVISVCVLIYGYVLYQHRISMIRRRDPGHFDALAGPILLSIALFFAVLANFIIRGTHVAYLFQKSPRSTRSSHPPIIFSSRATKETNPHSWHRVHRVLVRKYPFRQHDCHDLLWLAATPVIVVGPIHDCFVGTSSPNQKNEEAELRDRHYNRILCC